MPAVPLPASLESCPPPYGVRPAALGVPLGDTISPFHSDALSIQLLAAPLSSTHLGRNPSDNHLGGRQWLELHRGAPLGSNWAVSPPAENARPSPPARSLLTCPQESNPGAQEEDKGPCSMVCNCEKLEATQVFVKVAKTRARRGRENHMAVPGRLETHVDLCTQSLQTLSAKNKELNDIV